jgi:hypothetical protein
MKGEQHAMDLRRAERRRGVGNANGVLNGILGGVFIPD